MRAILLLLVGLMLSAAQAATPADAPLTPEQDARYRVLIHELRCLVCQNQTIADSNAELAADLREQVHARIAAGESDEQIRHYLTDRYGDFVLYKPPLTARTVLLWLGPFLVLGLALSIVLKILRVRARAPNPDASPVDAARLRQLLDEER